MSQNTAATWTFFSFLAGLQQGTSPATRVGNQIKIVAVEAFVNIFPQVANMGGGGDVCRVVIYHNKAAGGLVAQSAAVWDTNVLTTGRNVNFKDQYSILADFTHSMTVTADNGGTGAALWAGPRFFKCVRVPMKHAAKFNGNSGTTSDLSEDDIGVGFVSSGANCCNIVVTSKVWFKDV